MTVAATSRMNGFSWFHQNHEHERKGKNMASGGGTIGGVGALKKNSKFGTLQPNLIKPLKNRN